ncbi:hypothetical protein QCA50_004802 [Cerrena zonata]|uniref:Uncharacterized protein n=1 Tax=Cerrena zonata TaxID=2478898 RepID=A0AAW0GCZ7_9APHY
MDASLASLLSIPQRHSTSLSYSVARLWYRAHHALYIARSLPSMRYGCFRDIGASKMLSFSPQHVNHNCNSLPIMTLSSIYTFICLFAQTFQQTPYMNDNNGTVEGGTKFHKVHE